MASLTAAEVRAVRERRIVPSPRIAPVAKGELRDSGMNKTEAAYAERLRLRRPKWMAYAAVTLKLGPDCRYTPDFGVMFDDDVIEYHETKGGFIRDGALEKLRTAAGMFPFRFYLAQYKGGEWTVKRI